MNDHQYLVRSSTDDYDGQRVNCIFEEYQNPDIESHIVTFESRKEYICVMKFLSKEKETYGPVFIGLKADADDDMKNLFQWEGSSAGDLAFTAWDPASPSGKGDCVTVSVGSSNAKSGLWTDAVCNTALPVICERQAVGTTSAPTRATSKS
jgi:hypothetical protein